MKTNSAFGESINKLREQLAKFDEAPSAERTGTTSLRDIEERGNAARERIKPAASDR